VTTLPYPRHVDLSLRLLPFVLVAVMIVLTNKIETRFFPVVEHWDLQTIERAGDHYILNGKLNKVRACEMVATTVMAVPKIPLAPKVLLYRISPDELAGAQIPTGVTEWGPWRMKIPEAFLQHRDKIDYIEIVGIHRCHAFWLQETVYGRVSVERLP
jgi:hypothetical protein